ncbi:MAG: hypothetical protein WAM58_19710 [Candidatus Acidiferrum sp.]
MSDLLADDRASLCTFTFADGRHCRMLRSRDTDYCLYHLQIIEGQQAPGLPVSPISMPVSGEYVPVTALTQSLSRLFCAVAEGRMDPKRAIALARVASTLLKCIGGATQEFKEVYVDDFWRQLIYSHYEGLPDLVPDEETDAADKSSKGSNASANGSAKPQNSRSSENGRGARNQGK